MLVFLSLFQGSISISITFPLFFLEHKIEIFSKHNLQKIFQITKMSVLLCKYIPEFVEDSGEY